MQNQSLKELAFSACIEGAYIVRLTGLSRISASYPGTILFVVHQPFEKAPNDPLPVRERTLFPGMLRSTCHTDLLPNNIGVIGQESSQVKRGRGVIARNVTPVWYVDRRKQIRIFQMGL